MGRTTIVVIPDGKRSTKQFDVSDMVVRLFAVGGLFAAAAFGYMLLDYSQLRAIRTDYYAIVAENEGLKGEARLLMDNLESVRGSLKRVQDYTTKLSELTDFRVQKIAKKTGIGPLTEEEYVKAKRSGSGDMSDSFMPVGINLENLFFRPVFDRLTNIGENSNQHVLELQKLLSTLSQQKSILGSIPSISPVNGWIASGYGYRTSPFTGKRTMHMGIDVASPIGTPIFAPADGVVIFSGSKAGFGNFIMIAHGYGVVSRYGHNAQNMVQPGQRVSRGDQIATVGMTGRTTGPHLHYEVVVDGKNQNPKKFILNLSNDLTVY